MKYKKILLLGSSGMLGSEFPAFLKEDNLIRWDSEKDITQESIINDIINLRPDLIINCAAFTDVDACEDNMLCLSVNGLALKHLSQAALELKAPLVHFSTDYVFPGDNSEGYNEEAKSQPINKYGTAKELGEKFIKEINPPYYLIRTSWLYGRNGKNFVDTIIRAAKDKGQLKVVNDQHGSPTWTVDLVKHVIKLLNSKKPFGIYHFSASGQTTWFDFCKEILKLKGIECQVEPQSSADLDRKAKRPKFSKLLNTKFEPMREWREMIEEYVGNE